MKTSFGIVPPSVHPYAVEVVGSAPGSQWVELETCATEIQANQIIARERDNDASAESLTVWRYRVVSRKRALTSPAKRIP